MVLEVRDVVKEYRIPGQPAIRVLDGVSFSVSAGEHVAITGRSGAGKTTLLNILGGLDRPDSGSVKCVGNVGFVFQSFRLMPELTVLENALLPTMKRSFIRSSSALSAAACKARATELLERVGLKDRLEHLPGELSGGEQQRVALARALVSSPKIVLADEPTGNLDAMTGAEVLRMLQELSQGSSVALVMVTHSPGAAAVCDRVLTLENGVLVSV
jgi:putative ABC transport system ATP-binding protein